MMPAAPAAEEAAEAESKQNSTLQLKDFGSKKIPVIKEFALLQGSG
ncbi:hypothetical protein GBAR_LOCUS19723 [Geodia barretti]|uniref:Uncharacterized protein n=1 Tax=Geodia barretti TaxID=519541 RepID=A0AA35X080_GEOBA|nr:hypothetical protein GBAR_LOCUS19723 [Geodia barretti]